MRPYEEDFEIEAIEKCSRALGKLDDKTKFRVIRYLLDKFGLIVKTEGESKEKEVINHNIQFQQNNLVLSEPKDLANTSHHISSGSIVSLKDVLIKGLAKTEPELLVVIAYYNSKFGKGTFTRQSILDSYRDNGVMSELRRKNLTQNLNSVIKKSYISTITDDELSISPEGCEYAVSILNGNSTTKKRKPRTKKSSTKSQNGKDEEVIDVEHE